MKQVIYGFLAIVMATGVLSESVQAASVASVPQDQVQSINTDNGANTGGAANTVSGTGNGAGGPGDGLGPGNGAGQGIGNGSSKSDDVSAEDATGGQTTLVESSDMSASSSPAPEPATWVLLGVGGSLVGTYWLRKRSLKVSGHSV